MAEANKGNQEPSMEEILSSIRRIIADEEAGPPEQPPRRLDEPPRAAAGDPTSGDEEDDEILELTEVVEPAAREDQRPPAPEAARPPRAELEPQQPPSALRAVPPSDQPRRSTPVNPPADNQDGLISAGAASASTSALTRLTRAAAAPEERPGSPLATVTVEKLLTDLMSPMLKEWLDQNLPTIVERIVEQEVKKLARRAEML